MDEYSGYYNFVPHFESNDNIHDRSSIRNNSRFNQFQRFPEAVENWANTSACETATQGNYNFNENMSSRFPSHEQQPRWTRIIQNSNFSAADEKSGYHFLKSSEDCKSKVNERLENYDLSENCKHYWSETIRKYSSANPMLRNVHPQQAIYNPNCNFHANSAKYMSTTCNTSNRFSMGPNPSNDLRHELQSSNKLTSVKQGLGNSYNKFSQSSSHNLNHTERLSMAVNSENDLRHELGKNKFVLKSGPSNSSEGLSRTCTHNRNEIISKTLLDETKSTKDLQLFETSSKDSSSEDISLNGVPLNIFGVPMTNEIVEEYMTKAAKSKIALPEPPPPLLSDHINLPIMIDSSVSDINEDLLCKYGGVVLNSKYQHMRQQRLKKEEYWRSKKPIIAYINFCEAPVKDCLQLLRSLLSKLGHKGAFIKYSRKLIDCHEIKVSRMVALQDIVANSPLTLHDEKLHVWSTSLTATSYSAGAPKTKVDWKKSKEKKRKAELVKKTKEQKKEEKKERKVEKFKRKKLRQKEKKKYYKNLKREHTNETIMHEASNLLVNSPTMIMEVAVANTVLLLRDLESLAERANAALTDGSNAALAESSNTTLVDSRNTALAEGSNAALAESSNTTLVDGSNSVLADGSNAALAEDSNTALAEGSNTALAEGSNTALAEVTSTVRRVDMALEDRAKPVMMDE